MLEISIETLRRPSPALDSLDAADVEKASLSLRNRAKIRPAVISLASSLTIAVSLNYSPANYSRKNVVRRGRTRRPGGIAAWRHKRRFLARKA